jgi:hypothetical protein
MVQHQTILVHLLGFLLGPTATARTQIPTNKNRRLRSRAGARCLNASPRALATGEEWGPMRSILLALSILVVLPPTLRCQSTIRPLTTILEVQPAGSGMTLGTGILGLGDVNGDGWPDFAVSARAIRKTFIYLGGPGILDDTPDLTIKGGGPMAKGDLNGDGRMDLVVATRETLLVYLGMFPSPVGIDTMPDLIIPRESGGGGETNFGQSFAIGDLNNDGFDDLLVGAPGYDLSRGKVYTYLGKPNFTPFPDFAETADSVCAAYGTTVRIGDINGDGYDDLCIGSLVYVNCTGFPVDSRLDVFYGKRDWRFDKNAYNQRLDKTNTGFTTLYWFNLLDADGDAKADISFNWDRKEYFLFGRSDSISTVPDLVLTNPDTNLYTGIYGPAVDIGDINNDGMSDFVVRGTRGGPAMCLIVYLSSLSRAPVPAAGRCRGFVEISDAFLNVTGSGDVNGDGVNDFAACVPRDPLSSLPQDGYFVILSGDATLTVAGEDKQGSFQKDGILHNYPNPFNAQTIIEYSLAKGGEVVLIIYDPLGREVRRLQQGEQGPGLHQVAWDGKTSLGDNAASGAYYYSLVVDKATVGARKLLLLR